MRIDHSINSKYQLMGHYLHDAMTKSFFPPLWGPGGDYPTVGTAMTNPSYTAAIRLTQTYTPNLLNETAFLYSGNKITLTPVAGAGNSFTLPSGWTANSFFPVANNAGHDMPEIDLQGSPLQQTWTESYYPWKNGYEGFDYRDDLSWTKGRHQFKFGFAWLHDYKNQQLQANTQGTAAFNSNNFSGDGYVNFLLGMASSFTQLEFLAGKHWVNNNYGFYGNDNWHVTPRLTLNLGLRFDGLPHAFERYDLFSNFVPADYDTSLGNPLNPDGTINQSAALDIQQDRQRAVLPEWNQGSERRRFPTRKRAELLQDLAAKDRLCLQPHRATARPYCGEAMACSSSVSRATTCTTLP